MNRIDEVIIFTELEKKQLEGILELMLKEVEEEVHSKDMTITFSSKVKEFLLDKGYDVKYGARPMRRAIQSYIEDEISEMFLRRIFKAGSKIKVDFDGEKVTFK